MKSNWWFGLLVGMVGSLALLALVGAANAQGGKPPDVTITVQPLDPTGGGGPNAPLGTTFSYQGLLKKSGVPYTGNCDMQFKLWNGHSDAGAVIVVRATPRRRVR